MNPPNKNIPSFFWGFASNKSRKISDSFFSQGFKVCHVQADVQRQPQNRFSRSKSSPKKRLGEGVFAAEAAASRDLFALKVKVIHLGKNWGEVWVHFGWQQTFTWKVADGMLTLRYVEVSAELPNQGLKNLVLAWFHWWMTFWILADFLGQCVASIRAWNLEDIYIVTSSILLHLLWATCLGFSSSFRDHQKWSASQVALCLVEKTYSKVSVVSRWSNETRDIGRCCMMSWKGRLMMMQ